MTAEYYQAIRKQNITFKIMLVGLTGVGKSSIMTRFIQKRFIPQLPSTVGIDFIDTKFRHKTKNIRVELWDTSGQQIYKIACANRMNRANCVIFVYSMQSSQLQKSVKDITNFWLPTAAQICNKQILFYCFGNKTDMVQKQQMVDGIRHQVELSMAQFSKTLERQIQYFYGNCKYAQNNGIKQMMSSIIDKLYQEAIKKEELQTILYKKSLISFDRPTANSQTRQSFKLKSKISSESQFRKKKCC